MLTTIISLTGFAAFVAALFLSLRLRTVVRLLGGIAAQYRLHHYLGLLCIGCIILHVISQFISLGRTDWPSLFEFSDLGLLAGWVAFLLLLQAFSAVWLKKIPYRLWRFLHLLFVPAYVFALVHIWLFVPGSGVKLWLAVVIGTLGVIILTGLFLSHFIPLSHRDFTIGVVRNLGGQIYEIDLSPRISKGQVTDYPAGEIIYVRFNVPNFTRGWHPFSVASCRVDPMLRLVVKSFGHDTQQIPLLKPGEYVSVAGPFSEFSVSPGENQVWLAGGIGLAPFLGMTRCLKVMPFRSVQMFYFVNSMQELTCAPELDATAEKFPNFSWKGIVLPRGATIPSKTISEITQRDATSQYLICGPPGFMRVIRKTLVRSGISPKYVHSEEFSTW